MQTLEIKPAINTEQDIMGYFHMRCVESEDFKGYISKTKLLKLSYFAYAWFLVFTENEQTLFPGPIQAGLLGPLSAEQWKMGYSEVPPTIDELNLHPETKNFLNWIFESYGDMSNQELIATTHMEHVYVECHEDVEALAAELRAENMDKSVINKLPVMDDDKIYAQYLEASLLIAN